MNFLEFSFFCEILNFPGIRFFRIVFNKFNFSGILNLWQINFFAIYLQLLRKICYFSNVI